jgi:hypothetical protein
MLVDGSSSYLELKSACYYRWMMGHEPAFAKISSCLRQAMEAPTVEESHALIAEALRRTEGLSKAVATAAAKRGSKGGIKTAQRGPDYYRNIAAMRKTRAGGRPKKRTGSE